MILLALACAQPEPGEALAQDSVDTDVPPCGANPWGDVVAAAYVDARAAAGGDGSREAPYADLAAAIDAGATDIALAAGDYAAALVVTQGDLRIAGACPRLVTLRGDGDAVVDARGGTLTLSGVTISGAKEGVVASGGAVVALDDVVLTALTWTAVHVTGAGTSVSLTQSEAYAIGPERWRLGAALHAEQGGELIVEDSSVFDVTPIGLWVSGDGSIGRVRASGVRDTRPLEGGGGLGAQIDDGGTLRVSESTFAGNTAAGIWASDGTLVLYDSEVSDTRVYDDGVGGAGVLATDGALVDVRDTRIVDNHGIAALWATDAGTGVGMERTELSGTTAISPGVGGYGLGVVRQAVFYGIDVVVARNEVVGVAVGGLYTFFTLVTSEITDTRPDARVQFGHGVEIGDGAVVTLRDTVVDGARSVGILIGDVDTDVTLEGVTVRNVTPAADASVGGGVGIQAAATVAATSLTIEDIDGPGLIVGRSTLRCEGCPVTDTAFAGLALHDGGDATLTDCAISGVTAQASTGGGIGVLVNNLGDLDTTLALERCTVSGAPLAALYVDGDGHYSVRDSELVAGVGVDIQGIPVHGNAVFARGGVTDLVFSGNTLRGAADVSMLLDASSVTLDGNLWEDNGWDIVLQHCLAEGEGAAPWEILGSDEAARVELCPAWDRLTLHPVYDIRFGEADLDL